jgi:hypothetical protein
MVKYNRKQRVYVSDVVPGTFPTRLDAESAELPPEVLDAAMDATGDLATAIRVARILTFGHVESLGNGAYLVASDSGESYHLKGRSCTCPSYRRPCKHYHAVRAWKRKSRQRAAERLAYNVELLRGPAPENPDFFG